MFAALRAICALWLFQESNLWSEKWVNEATGRGQKLRNELRVATAEVHDRLDRAVGRWPLGSQADYSAFLSAQYRARSAAEKAFQLQNPADLPVPPGQSALLAADLNDLGTAVPPAGGSVAFADSFEALGGAWVVAGSSLGNKSMLAARRKAACPGPDRFLSDQTMAHYFGDVLKVMERDHPTGATQAAIRGALACFDVFEAAFALETVEHAA